MNHHEVANLNLRGAHQMEGDRALPGIGAFLVIHLLRQLHRERFGHHQHRRMINIRRPGNGHADSGLQALHARADFGHDAARAGAERNTVIPLLDRTCGRFKLRQLVRQGVAPELIGSHPAWQQCLDQITSLTSFGYDLVLQGEAGVGKTPLAQFAHAISQRSAAPFITIDGRVLHATPQLAEVFAADHEESVWSRAGEGSVLVQHAHVLPPDVWTTIADVVT